MGASFVRALLLCGAVLLWSGSAQAGDFYAHPLCMDHQEIYDYFQGANFNGTANCEALCKRAGARCKSYMARAQSCEKAANKDDTYWAKETTCDVLENDADRKLCRESYDATAKAIKDAITAETEVARAGCDNIRDTCTMLCFPL